MLRHVTAILLCTVVPLSAEDWREFRGPSGDGRYTGPKLPINIGVGKEHVWRVDVPGKGWSSPIVCKDRVYLTTAVETKDGHTLQAICVNAKNGETIFAVDVFQQPSTAAPKIHSKNSHASPTPVIDGERLYVHFGHMGTAAIDVKSAKVVWRKQNLYAKPVHGNGGSPILVDGKLIFSCDALDARFLIALDAKTGNQVWKQDRKSTPGKPFSFSTPQVITDGTKKTILSTGSDLIAAYEADTGKEKWRATFSGYSIIQRPVVGNDMVYVSTAYDRPELLAVKLGGSGDVTQSHIAWRINKAVPNTPSFILTGDLLFMVSDAGLMTCLDAKSGKQIWQERLKGGFSASPMLADGKIYVVNETGDGWVIEADREYKVVSEFKFNEKVFASFAGVDGALFARTETKLYRFGTK